MTTSLRKAFFHSALLAAAAFFANGVSAQVVITNATIAAGGITPGDSPGFPATLSISGSYKFGENIILTSLSHTPPDGIDITGDDVTLDLNGFTIAGTNTCSKTGHTRGNTCVGIFPTSAQFLVSITGSRVTVKNGNIVGSKNMGVYIDGEYVRLESLTVSQSLGSGIDAEFAASPSSVILTDVTSVLNGIAGYVAPLPLRGTSMVSNSVFSDNTDGMLIFDGIASNVTAAFNDGDGIRSERTSIDHANTVYNSGVGIQDGAIVRDSVSDYNDTGFHNTASQGTSAMYINSSATSNTEGFVMDTGVGCYTDIYAQWNTTSDITGGTPLTGTHVTCP